MTHGRHHRPVWATNYGLGNHAYVIDGCVGCVFVFNLRNQQQMMTFFLTSQQHFELYLNDPQSKLWTRQ